MTKVLLIEDDSETAEKSQPSWPIAVEVNGRHGIERPRQGAIIAARCHDRRPAVTWKMDGLTVIEALRKDQVRTRCWSEALLARR